MLIQTGFRLGGRHDKDKKPRQSYMINYDGVSLILYTGFKVFELDKGWTIQLYYNHRHLQKWLPDPPFRRMNEIHCE